MDVAGYVAAVGKDVRQFKPGDAVFGVCDGSFAEYATAHPHRLAPKPTSLTFQQAAAVPVSALAALQAVRDEGQVQPGQQVLIIGAAGGVGTFAVQIAKAFGAHVTGVCSTTKVDLVRTIGADSVIGYTRQAVTVGRRRYHVILDLAGNRSLAQLRRALSPRGTLVIVGGEGGGRWFGGIDRQLRAYLLSPFLHQTLRPQFPKGRAGDLQLLSNLIEGGTATPVIDRTGPLDAAVEALRYLEQGHARGKVVLTV
jgi:NADPH:quinone reductase-like Zn-dependent oxidoreductase